MKNTWAPAVGPAVERRLVDADDAERWRVRATLHARAAQVLAAGRPWANAAWHCATGSISEKGFRENVQGAFPIAHAAGCFRTFQGVLGV